RHLGQRADVGGGHMSLFQQFGAATYNFEAGPWEQLTNWTNCYVGWRKYTAYSNDQQPIASWTDVRGLVNANAIASIVAIGDFNGTGAQCAQFQSAGQSYAAFDQLGSNMNGTKSLSLILCGS